MPRTSTIVNRYFMWYPLILLFFFFNDTATTEIYTLSLHDALPISFTLSARRSSSFPRTTRPRGSSPGARDKGIGGGAVKVRSEEHTSELQSLAYLVCRLLLEKKKQNLHTILRFMRSRPTASS